MKGNLVSGRAKATKAGTLLSAGSDAFTSEAVDKSSESNSTECVFTGEAVNESSALNSTEFHDVELLLLLLVVVAEGTEATEVEPVVLLGLLLGTETVSEAGELSSW